MRIRNELVVNQSQKLSLTPALKQSLEILRLSQKELNDFLEEELVNNPILKKEYFKIRRSNYSKSRGNSNDVYSNVSTGEGINLLDHLESQLREIKLDSIDREMANFIIGNIDENGYLDIENEEITQRYYVDSERVEQVISLVQSLDPPGIGARDLQELLLIQLKNRNLEQSLAYKVVQHALEDLASNKIKDMAQRFKVSAEDILDAKEVITSLNPRPGSQFSHSSRAKYVEPDVIVEKIDGEYKVKLTNENNYNEYNLESYYSNIKKENYSEEEYEYIYEKMQTAKNIMNSIKQRNETILKVATEIVKFQKDYFDKGKLYLKPFSRKRIAETLEIHESTVSRAVKGKTMQCRRGLIELSFFFQSAIETDSQDTVSAEAVKLKIQKLIETENKYEPLSDNKIAKSLLGEGIKISRRCVAKYRIAINIPASAKRKKY